MSTTLRLNQPSLVTLAPGVGDVLHVHVPEGTVQLHVSSTDPLFLDYGESADGDPGTSDLQFPIPAFGVRMDVPELESLQIYRVVGTVASQEVWLLPRGRTSSEIASEVSAESTEQYLENLLRHLPEHYRTFSEILSAPARALAEVRASGDILRRQATLKHGEGRWLTLHGRGLGVERTTQELDAALRGRIRDVADRVTRPAVMTAVNAALAEVTNETAYMVEWFEGPRLADDGSPSDPAVTGGQPFHIGNPDQARMVGGPGTFAIVAPRLSGDFTEDIYHQIVSIVETHKPAGTVWALAIEPN